MALIVKNLPEMQETWVWSLGWEDPLEKGMATHSSILAWRIPWTQETKRLQSMGSHRVRQDWVTDTFTLGSPGGSDGKESACTMGDLGSILGSGNLPDLIKCPYYILLLCPIPLLAAAAAAAKSLQLCPTLRDPVDSSPPGSSIHRIL